MILQESDNLLRKCPMPLWDQLLDKIPSRNFWNIGTELLSNWKSTWRRNSFLMDCTSNISSLKVFTLKCRFNSESLNPEKYAVSCYSKETIWGNYYRSKGKCWGSQNVEVNFRDIELSISYANQIFGSNPEYYRQMWK